MALHLRGIILPEGRSHDIFVVGGRFTFRPVDDAQTILDGGYIVPGLVDVHAHLSLASPAHSSASPKEAARASARAQLEAGVLAIREPGSPDRASLGLGPKQTLPRTYTAGRFLASPGGYFPGLAREVRENELPDAAEEEARRSGEWAKVIGDWPDSDGRMRPNFSPQALAEAARHVHALGARIAVHATTPESIEYAIEAGVDSIEHGLGLQDEHISAMVANNVALVPTLVILPMIPSVVDNFELTEPEADAMLSAARRHPEMVQRASKAGVLILAGTDAGMGPHGMIREEIRELQAAGLSPEMALAAGSWEARRFLGLPSIEEGGLADLVAYPDDPRGNPEVLAKPSLRVLDGRRIPSTLH